MYNCQDVLLKGCTVIHYAVRLYCKGYCCCKSVGWQFSLEYRLLRTQAPFSNWLDRLFPGCFFIQSFLFLVGNLVLGHGEWIYAEAPAERLV